MRYSRLLEENSFSNRRADYIWLLMLVAGFLLAISPLVTMPFLSSSLAFSLVYIWARRNPSVKMSLFGVVTYVQIARLADSKDHSTISPVLPCCVQLAVAGRIPGCIGGYCQ